MAADVYDEVFAELAARRTALEDRLALLTSRKGEQTPKGTADQYRAVLAAVQEALAGDALTPAEKHAILSTLIERIVPEGESHLTVRLKAMADSVNTVEIIQWFRRWDEGSEEELGVPENAGREMMTERMRPERMRQERIRQELPS
jgi:hypothetical protein